MRQRLWLRDLRDLELSELRQLRDLKLRELRDLEMTELQPAAGGPAGGIAQRGGTWPGQGGACGVVRAPRPDGKPLPPPNKPKKPVPASVSASASAPAPVAASVAAAAAVAAAEAAVTMAEEEVEVGGARGLSRGGERMSMLELPGGHVLLQAREHTRPRHTAHARCPHGGTIKASTLYDPGRLGRRHQCCAAVTRRSDDRAAAALAGRPLPRCGEPS